MWWIEPEERGREASVVGTDLLAGLQGRKRHSISRLSDGKPQRKSALWRSQLQSQHAKDGSCQPNPVEVIPKPDGEGRALPAGHGKQGA